MYLRSTFVEQRPVLTGSHAARNWIGVVGAFTADMLLQFSAWALSC